VVKSKLNCEVRRIGDHKEKVKMEAFLKDGGKRRISKVHAGE